MGGLGSISIPVPDFQFPQIDVGKMFDEKLMQKSKNRRPKLPQLYELTLKAHYQKLVNDNDVVIFTTTTCPFNRIAEQSLVDSKIQFKTVHLNTYFEQDGGYNIIGSLLHKHVVEATGSNQVPNIVIKNHNVGGNSALRHKLANGELKQILDKCQI